MAVPKYFKRLFREFVTGEGSSEVANQSPVQSVNSKTGDVTINVPVDSVNGETGTVTLSASDVNALADTYSAPVQSVNGETGDVTVGGAQPEGVVQTYSDLPTPKVTERELYYVDNARDGDFVYPTRLSPVRWVSLIDGSLVASGSPVVAEFRGSSYTSGDTTLPDLEPFGGDQDATLTDNGLSEATASDGSDAIESGGSSYGEFTIPSELSGSAINTISVELSVQYTSINAFGRWFGTVNDNDSQEIGAYTDTDENNNSDDGNFVFILTDQNGNTIKCAPSSNPNLNDGTRHDITFDVIDASANNVKILIDGSSVPLSFSITGSPSSFGGWDSPMGLMALDGGNKPRAGKYITFRFLAE